VTLPRALTWVLFVAAAGACGASQDEPTSDATTTDSSGYDSIATDSTPSDSRVDARATDSTVLDSDGETHGPPTSVALFRYADVRIDV